ncbi:hypothetical protein ACLFKT_34750, partial [Paraburkholderia sp. BR14261]
MNMRAVETDRQIDTDYRLEDRYLREDGAVFLTGTQALVRILIEQARADRLAGLKTAGLVSGYRGSPLGGFDQELWRQKALLADFDVRFEPALNEDLGATMLWGAQQLDAFPGKRVEGVYSMWYGKGPGVDRTGDVFRNANMLGTARHGGVLAVAGDDHAAQSSMFPHQTDHVFEGAMMPILFPASVEEYIEYGLTGYALSRFSGLWVVVEAALRRHGDVRGQAQRHAAAHAHRAAAFHRLRNRLETDPQSAETRQRIAGEPVLDVFLYRRR